MTNIAPFNRFGTDITSAKTIEEAVTMANLNWEVIRDDVFVRDPQDASKSIKVKGQKALRRADTGEVLSIMSDTYRPVQIAEKMALINDIIGEGKATFDRALSIDGAKRFVLVVKLPGDIQVTSKDVVQKYLMTFDSFDGSLSFGVAITPVRVWCQNMLHRAIKASSSVFRLRHSVNVADRVREAQRALGLVVRSYDDFAAEAKGLAATRYSTAQVTELAQHLFPANEENELTTKSKAARDQIINLFDNGAGHEHIRGTAWAAVNAVAEYTDHHRGTRVVAGGSQREEARANSILFGAGKNFKARALTFIQHQLAA